MKCPKCGSKAIKYGFEHSEQTYRCTNSSCGYHFKKTTNTRKTAEERRKIFDELHETGNLKEICNKYHISKRTIKYWSSYDGQS